MFAFYLRARHTDQGGLTSIAFTSRYPLKWIFTQASQGQGLYVIFSKNILGILEKACLSVKPFLLEAIGNAWWCYQEANCDFKAVNTATLNIVNRLCRTIGLS